ncbi:MAG: amidohydrolase family protein [Verrucomicrobiota bacterium]
MRIDAHHHLWNYSAKEYGWISDSMPALKHNFTPADLKPLLKKSSLDGCVTVQARSSLQENDFLLEHAKQNPFIKAVVGWVDLTQPDAAPTLARYSEHEAFKGIRHVLQGETDDAYCLRPDFNRGLSLLHDFGLAYDILIRHHQLPNAIKMVDQHPDQVFILDHLAKPEIKSTTPDPGWVKNIKNLARRGHVFCKISGLVTEVPTSMKWTPDLLRPYFEVALEAFGPQRLMFGSDWPVALLRCNYSDWFQTVSDFSARLTPAEQQALFGHNAARAYRIG